MSASAFPEGVAPKAPGQHCTSTTETAPVPPRLTRRPVLVIAAVAAAVHLAVATRYGWHRDEFY